MYVIRHAQKKQQKYNTTDVGCIPAGFQTLRRDGGHLLRNEAADEMTNVFRFAEYLPYRKSINLSTATVKRGNSIRIFDHFLQKSIVKNVK